MDSNENISTEKADKQPIRSDNEQDTESHAETYFDIYNSYAKTLRNWLVVYGIGAPVIFLTQEHIFTKISKAPNIRCIVYVYLAGVAFQVLIALLNKWTNWYMFSGEVDDKVRQQRAYRIFDRVRDKTLIDILADIGTISAFGWSTYQILLIFTK